MLGRTMTVATILLLTACEGAVQTSSGTAYLAKYTMPDTAPPSDGEVRSAAAVEPLLTFPARIGVARIADGRLTSIPPEETEEWVKLAQRLGPSWGEFVPLSPLVAKLAASGLPEQRRSDRAYAYRDSLETILREIRLGAGRQHVDAALIYEVMATSRNEGTALGVANLTIIGAWIVPSHLVNARGVATALLVDVRNGYPYGFTDTVYAEEDSFHPAMGSDDKARELADAARIAAARKLAPEVEKLALKLRAELAEKRLAAAPR